MKRVLIVDDNPANREPLAMLLSDCGFDVVTAASGQQALVKLRQDAPDAVVLDMKMPGMDGREFLRIKAEHPCIAGVPVLAVSGDPVAAESVKGSVARVFVKPYQPDELVRALGELLGE